MTWNDTHARTRIFREVEAAAAADLTGALPWRSEWAQYFDGPTGLVAALRARWARMCEAQLDSRTGEDEFHDTMYRLRRSNAGVLAILQNADAAATVRELDRSAPRAVRTPRVVRFRGGPVLPTR